MNDNFEGSHSSSKITRSNKTLGTQFLQNIQITLFKGLSSLAIVSVLVTNISFSLKHLNYAYFYCVLSLFIETRSKKSSQNGQPSVITSTQSNETISSTTDIETVSSSIANSQRSKNSIDDDSLGEAETDTVLIPSEMCEQVLDSETGWVIFNYLPT